MRKKKPPHLNKTPSRPDTSLHLPRLRKIKQSHHLRRSTSCLDPTTRALPVSGGRGGLKRGTGAAPGRKNRRRSRCAEYPSSDAGLSCLSGFVERARLCTWRAGCGGGVSCSRRRLRVGSPARVWPWFRCRFRLSARVGLEWW